MNYYPHPIIAREGWSFLSIAVGSALFMALLSTVWSIPFWIFAVFALQVSVFMSVFNVHSNRAPADGKVHAIQYFPGKFASRARDKASVENERNALVITTNSGQTIACVQVAGLIARRILCYARAGEALMRGQRYGFICFGFRVDVYLPRTAIPKVTERDKVFATETILAELKSY